MKKYIECLFYDSYSEESGSSHKGNCTLGGECRGSTAQEPRKCGRHEDIMIDINRVYKLKLKKNKWAKWHR